MTTTKHMKKSVIKMIFIAFFSCINIDKSEFVKLHSTHSHVSTEDAVNVSFDEENELIQLWTVKESFPI